LISDAYALQAIKLIGQSLRAFVANPKNIEAATIMLVGSTLAGASY